MSVLRGWLWASWHPRKAQTQPCAEHYWSMRKITARHSSYNISTYLLCKQLLNWQVQLWKGVFVTADRLSLFELQHKHLKMKGHKEDAERQLTAWGIHTSFQVISAMWGNIYDHSIHVHPFSTKFARSAVETLNRISKNCRTSQNRSQCICILGIQLPSQRNFTKDSKTGRGKQTSKRKSKSSAAMVSGDTSCPCRLRCPDLSVQLCLIHGASFHVCCCFF